MRRAPACLLAVAVTTAAAGAAWCAEGPGAGAGRSGFEAAPATVLPAEASRPVLAPPASGDEAVAALFMWHRTRKVVLSDSARAAIADSVDRADRARQPVLNAARVQALMRSLTLPGWGQSSMGHPRAARVFEFVEAGV